jgi:hypothetical protein
MEQSFRYSIQSHKLYYAPSWRQPRMMPPAVNGVGRLPGVAGDTTVSISV